MAACREWIVRFGVLAERGLGAEDDGGGDVAVFGDEDVESATQGAVIHDFEADSLLAEQCVYLRIRE